MSEGMIQVLRALQASGDEPCSGPALSSQLGVSRAQVWKHVGALRRRGYEITGEPGGGYRLEASPDRLYPEELDAGLETKWIARRIEYLDETDSTNRVALELGRQGAEAGTTVIAEGQTAGRGRLGRNFYSPPYLNLYTSILLRPNLTIAEAPTLILASAIAVAEAVADTLDDSEAVEIKWPNDVLIGGSKTSGILMEMSAEASRVSFVVLGIGVNLNGKRDDFPDEFRALATTVSEANGRPVDRADFARRLYAALEEILELHETSGWEGVRPRFESRFRMRGREVEVKDMNGESLSGIAHGIANDGALEIECTQGARAGEIVRVVAGDVTLVKKSDSRRSETFE